MANRKKKFPFSYYYYSSLFDTFYILQYKSFLSFLFSVWHYYSIGKWKRVMGWSHPFQMEDRSIWDFYLFFLFIKKKPLFLSFLCSIWFVSSFNSSKNSFNVESCSDLKLWFWCWASYSILYLDLFMCMCVYTYINFNEMLCFSIFFFSFLFHSIQCSVTIRNEHRQQCVWVFLLFEMNQWSWKGCPISFGSEPITTDDVDVDVSTISKDYKIHRNKDIQNTAERIKKKIE